MHPVEARGQYPPGQYPAAVPVYYPAPPTPPYPSVDQFVPHVYPAMHQHMPAAPSDGVFYRVDGRGQPSVESVLTPDYPVAPQQYRALPRTRERVTTPRDGHNVPPMNRSTVPLTDPHPEQQPSTHKQRTPVPVAQDPPRIMTSHTNEGCSTSRPTAQDRNTPDDLNPDKSEPIATPGATSLPRNTTPVSAVGTQTGKETQSSEPTLAHKIESTEAQQGFEPPLDMGPDAVSLLVVTTYG